VSNPRSRLSPHGMLIGSPLPGELPGAGGGIGPTPEHFPPQNDVNDLIRPAAPILNCATPQVEEVLSQCDMACPRSASLPHFQHGHTFPVGRRPPTRKPPPADQGMTTGFKTLALCVNYYTSLLVRARVAAGLL